jgi:hypothetical protein
MKKHSKTNICAFWKNTARITINDICGIELDCRFRADSDDNYLSEGGALGYDGLGR